MEALILLVLVSIFWIVSSRRWRRLLVKPIAVLVVIYLILTSPLTVKLATWGITAPLPVDTGEPTDAIVVLGRGEELRSHRVEVAHKLWLAKRAPRIFASGMMDAQPIVDRLKQIEIPASHLSGEGCSQTTEENSLYTAAILYPQGVRKILLVTDSPHILRSLLLFQSVGFVVLPQSSLVPPDWSPFKKIQLLTREYILLIYQWLNGYFRPRSRVEIEHPPPEISEKFSSWHCLAK